MNLIEMKVALDDFEEKLAQFGGKSVYQLYHSDPDGISSAANSRIILKGLGMKIVASGHINYASGLDSKKVAEILGSGGQVFFSSDLPLHERAQKAGEDNPFENVLKIANAKEAAFVLDHHSPIKGGIIEFGAQKFFENSKINYLNSAFFKEFENNSFQCCASGMAYELGKENFDVLDWIAAIGIIEDVCEPAWKDLLSKVFSEHGEAQIRRSAKLIQFGRMESPKYVNMAVDILAKASSPQTILHPKGRLQKEFFDVADSNLRSFETLQDKFKRESVQNGNVIFFQYAGGSKSGIVSTLSNWASQEAAYCDKVVAIYGISEKDFGDAAFFSLRNQNFKTNGISMADAAKTLTTNYEHAFAGGHLPAAGCNFPAQYLDEFKQGLVNFVDERFQG